MAVSINEVETTAAKAFEASGVPWGIYEGAGRCVAWLELHGFPGVAMAVDALNNGSANLGAGIEPVHADGQSQTLDAGNLSALVCGGMLIDYAGVQSTQVVVTGLRDAVAVLGWLAHAPGGPALQVGIRANGDSHGGTRVHRRVSFHRASDMALPENADLVVRTGRPTHAEADSALENAAERLITTGIEPNADAWSALKRGAAGVLVPSTDVSRALGTGGGNAND